MDDSTNIVGFVDKTNMIKYITTFMHVMINIYNMNKLSINKSKTKVMVVTKNKDLADFNDFGFDLGEDKIKGVTKMRILGALFDNKGSYESELNELFSNISFKLNLINKVSKYTTFKSRKMFVDSFVKSKILYMAPTYLSLPNKLKCKLNTFYMRACKNIYGGNTFRLSNKKALKKCGWLDCDTTIKISALNFFHKILYYQKPKDLVELFKVPSRSVSVISLNLKPNNKVFKDFYLFKAMNEYNNLKHNIRSQRPYHFKKSVKKLLQ